MTSKTAAQIVATSVSTIPGSFGVAMVYGGFLNHKAFGVIFGTFFLLVAYATYRVILGVAKDTL